MYKEVQFGFEVDTPGEQKALEHKHEQVKEHVLEDLKKTFRPEFLNRVDHTIVFKPLSKLDIKQILNIQLSDLQKRLRESQLVLKLTASAKDFLIEKGYSVDHGARPMRRAIQDYVEDPLASALLRGEFKAGDVVTVSRRGDKLELSVPQAAKAE